MDLELADKVAIVTGSSRGLGFATASALLNEGCQVCVCARGEARLQQAAAELRSTGAKGRLLAVRADLATPDGVATVVERTVREFGGLDILVNNVGQAGGRTLLDT